MFLTNVHDVNRQILSFLSINDITNLLDIDKDKIIYYLPEIINEIIGNGNFDCKFLIIKVLETHHLETDHLKMIKTLINYNDSFIKSDVYREIYEIISIRPRSSYTIIKNFFDIIPNDYDCSRKLSLYIFTYDRSGKFFNIIFNIIEIIYDKKLYGFVDSLIRFHNSESGKDTKSYRMLSCEDKGELYYLITKFELLRAVDKMIRVDENQQEIIFSNIKNNIKSLRKYS